MFSRTVFGKGELDHVNTRLMDWGVDQVHLFASKRYSTMGLNQGRGLGIDQEVDYLLTPSNSTPLLDACR